MLQMTEYSGIPKQLDRWLRDTKRAPARNPYIHVDKTMLIDILLGGFISCAFGAWQFAAWSYSFPTHIERLLFLIASCVALVTPLILVAFQMLLLVTTGFYFGSQALGDSMLRHRPSAASVGGGIYALCRAYIVVEAFIALRSTPAGVYSDVQWSSLVPHVH